MIYNKIDSFVRRSKRNVDLKIPLDTRLFYDWMDNNELLAGVSLLL